MMNSFILVRHSYDDHSYIDGKNDTNLTKEGIEIAKKSILRIYPQIEEKTVLIRHSTKIRAKETADIFYDYLTKKGMNCTCINDSGLTELYQGKLNFEKMSHQDKILFLQSCWDDFEKCRLEGNYQHRFGELKDKNIITVPGENHAEWSVRIATGLLNIISDIESSYQSIGIAHRGAIYEIERLVQLSNNQCKIEDVEKYQTRWMEYCQEYKLQFQDIENAKKNIKLYKKSRS